MVLITRNLSWWCFSYKPSSTFTEVNYHIWAQCCLVVVTVVVVMVLCVYTYTCVDVCMYMYTSKRCHNLDCMLKDSHLSAPQFHFIHFIFDSHSKKCVIVENMMLAVFACMHRYI